MLITSILPSKIMILVGAACLFWIGLLVVGFMALTGLPISSGWFTAGALMFAAFAWVLVMFREIREAIEMPDSFASDDSTDRKLLPLERADTSALLKSDRSSGEHCIPMDTPVRRRPRKARSAHVVSAQQSTISDFFSPDV